MMDDELERLYRLRWDALCKAIPHGCGMSNPLLAAVPVDYEDSKTRLLIIGQQTRGWGLWDEPLEGDRLTKLRDSYIDFGRGRNARGKKHNSPFFQAASKLQKLLNPESEPFRFMWLNLFICDQKSGDREWGLPNGAIVEDLRKASFLREEITILKPHAVVFFTGKGYDYTIKHPQFFPDAQLIPHSECWSEVRAAGLPTKSARTYHPKRLRLKKQFDAVLSEIATWIKQAA